MDVAELIEKLEKEIEKCVTTMSRTNDLDAMTRYAQVLDHLVSVRGKLTNPSTPTEIPEGSFSNVDFHWEHMVEMVSIYPDKALWNQEHPEVMKELQTCLNMLGREGWELVNYEHLGHCIPERENIGIVPGTGGGARFMITMKRRKDPTLPDETKHTRHLEL